MNNQLNIFEQNSETTNVNWLPDMPTAAAITNHNLIQLDARQENVREAKQAIQPHLSRIHSIILSALNRLGGEGTKDEIAAFTDLSPEQVHKRMSELEKQGKVIPNGKRMGNSGRNITIWKIQ